MRDRRRFRCDSTCAHRGHTRLRCIVRCGLHGAAQATPVARPYTASGCRVVWHRLAAPLAHTRRSRMVRRSGCEANPRIAMLSINEKVIAPKRSRPILCEKRRIACVNRHVLHKLRNGSRDCHLMLSLRARSAPSLIGSLPMHSHCQRRLRGRAQGSRLVPRSHPSGVSDRCVSLALSGYTDMDPVAASSRCSPARPPNPT